MPAQPTFRGGRDSAAAVPPHRFEVARGFLGDVLGLEHLNPRGPGEAFRFGGCCRWVAPTPQHSQPGDPSR